MFEDALSLHRSGQLREAGAIYRGILTQDPENADALHLLGVIDIQGSNFAAALYLIDRALALRPEDPVFLSSRGVALHGVGRLQDALASFDNAIARKSDYAEAFNNRGAVWRQLGRSETALEDFDSALTIDRNYVNALNNRGNILVALKRFEEALASLDSALSLAPDNPEASNNRGNASMGLGDFEEALSRFERALKLRPDYAEAMSNRGNALMRLRRIDDALASYDRALVLKPDFSEAHVNRGLALVQLNRVGEALSCFDRALSFEPRSADACLNRGIALLALGRASDAVKSYDRAIACRSGFVEAHVNRGNALRALAQFEEAQASYMRALCLRPDQPFLFGDWLHAKMKACEWSGLSAAFQALETKVEARTAAATPYAVLATPLSAACQKLAAETYIRQSSFRVSEKRPTANRFRNGRRGDRIRLGYFSSDLRDHPVARAIVELIEEHDRTRFEVIAFSSGPPSNDQMRVRLSQAFDKFIDVHAVADTDVVAMARRMGIDIAIDLNGYTEGARPQLFATRVAPVQVSFIGYPGTTGADYIDYKIADAVVLPEGLKAHFMEKIAFLPNCYLTSDVAGCLLDPAPARASAGLPESGFVFCCFNNSFKITPKEFDVWMRLLRRVPSSVLWLVDDNSTATLNLRLEAENRGVSGERLVFAQRLDLRAHLARQQLADLFVDTFHYNAHTTAIGALWAGVPVLTTLGNTFAARVGATLLHAVGLPELVCQSVAEYEATALEFATNSGAITLLRRKLAGLRAASPLFDIKQYARHLETAFEEMWERRLAQMPPEHIVVPRHA